MKEKGKETKRMYGGFAMRKPDERNPTRHSILIRMIKAYAHNYYHAKTNERKREMNQECKEYIRNVCLNRWEAQRYMRFYRNERRKE